MNHTNIFFTHVIQYPFGPASGGKFVWNSDHLFVQSPEGVSFATAAQADEFGVVAKQFGVYYGGGEITSEDDCCRPCLTVKSVVSKQMLYGCR